MKHKTIVFIMPTMEGGGAERVIATLANGFTEHGCQVVVVLTQAGRSIYELNGQIILEANPLNDSVEGQLRFIRRMLKKYKGSVFVSFLTYQNMYTLLAGTGLHQRIIVSERNDPATMLDGRNYLSGLRSFLYKRAERIVFQTKDAKKYFGKAIQKKGVIIPNPIRNDLPESYCGPREKRFVAYSRLDRQKNIPMMLEAFAAFSKKYSDYTLSIYGRGAEEEYLKSKARALGLAQKVEFCGFSKNVHSEIIKAAAFLSSSDYEGISNSMLEAMAIGLPCICTDCPIGGTKMFIKDGWNGMMTAVGDAAEMAEKMCRLAEDASLSACLSQNAARIKDRLSADIITLKWLNLLFPESCGYNP